MLKVEQEQVSGGRAGSRAASSCYSFHLDIQLYIMRATISRWGNSLALRIPKSAIDAAGLHEGDVVDVQEDGGVLRIARTRRIDIDEMIESLDPATIHAEVNWGPPVGREVW
jgi:antitoxin MazE